MFWQVMSIKAIGIAIKLTLEGTNQLVYFQTWIFGMVAVTCIITQLNYLNMVSIQYIFSEEICFLQYLDKIFKKYHVSILFRGKCLIILPTLLNLFCLWCCYLPYAFDMDAGIGYLQHSYCFSYLLCHVHFLHNFCQCNNVQGIIAEFSPELECKLHDKQIFLMLFLLQDYSGQSASSIASELCGFITVLSGTAVLHSTREPDPPPITGMSHRTNLYMNCLWFSIVTICCMYECITVDR